ncbi:ribonuclease T2 [Rhizobium sp. PP-F2F-G48]|uniref:ribonuclease T2 family protein n=1 Tax=Rhizobium sp. PP-F2F-G48 TaxID=2135651 RepID=UPI0010F3332D|nr:ribonuclease [Rhizobium sp. PP-F2F-G48]TCM57653.1 ribonuclease T2 [Rhizobium sp. PP-F2F-G48]
MAALLATLLLSGCGDEPSAEQTRGPATATPPILQTVPERSAEPSSRPASPMPDRRAPEERAPTKKRPEVARNVPIGSGFDFYVLSLSWSPSWCAENDRAGKTAQCNGQRDYRFIVHGLWPQNERGFPAFCPSRDGDRVPDALGRGLFDIIPSMGLIGHQWRKHGTCSGLGQRDYFAVLRAARERVRIPSTLETADARRRMSPAAIEMAMAEANPGMSPQGVAVTCGDDRLDEIRICLTRDLAFRACTEVDRGGCRARDLTIPSASRR